MNFVFKFEVTYLDDHGNVKKETVSAASREDCKSKFSSYRGVKINKVD